MKPKICIIITPDGIDTVSVLSTSGPEIRKEGHKLCSYLEDEITNFERAICNKIKKIKAENINQNVRK